MKLTGKQVKQIHTAMLDGYNPESLRRLVRVHLEENLHNIASGNNFSDQVFTLIEWAEQQGRVVELVRAAHEENANNPALQALWHDTQTWFAAPRTLSVRLSAHAEVLSKGMADETSGALAELPPAPQLFLSYSRHDTPIMQRLRVAIEAAGMTVWMDDGLEPGTPRWQTAIENAIRQTQGMVVILSPAAKQSEWVNIEVSVALRLQRRVFPVLVQGDDIDAVPLNLFTTQHVDARSDLAGPVATKLLPALRKHLRLGSGGVVEQGLAAVPTAQAGAEARPAATPPALLTTLRMVLVDLYLDEASAHRVVADAGLDGRHINFSGQATNTWHAIVQEAAKRDKLADLLAVALREYSANQPLQAAAAALHAWNKARLGDGTPVTEEPRPAQSWNLPDSRIVQDEAASPNATQPTVVSSQPAQPQIDFDWVTIPAGEFWMGSRKVADKPGLLDHLLGPAWKETPLTTPGDALAFDDETPQHRVYLPAYRIARTPVTNAQYKVFVEATKWQAPKHWTKSQIPKGKERHPVVYVDWHAAQAFCRWISAKTGQIIRLPTEAEWEKAARGINGYIWPWGNTPPTDKLCNFNRNVGDTTPVGNYPDGASPYGCLDMAGNMWEWTSTLFKKYPYKNNDGREDPKANGTRVLRGGSCHHDGVRCAGRHKLIPVPMTHDVGFRVVIANGAGSALGNMNMPSPGSRTRASVGRLAEVDTSANAGVE